MLYRSENPHGGDRYGPPVTLDFSANLNPYGTPPGVIAAVQGTLDRLHHYPDPQCRDLVQAIASFEDLPPEDILCGNGASALIFAYCQALAPAVAVELAPTFLGYSRALEAVGCRVVRFPLSQERDFLPDRALLTFLNEVRPDVVFLCHPNNPTGQLLPPLLLEAVAAFCRTHRTRLFLDECFLDLTDSGLSGKALLDQTPGLFLLKAFTKSYGMAGLRLGYGLSRDHDLLARMARQVSAWDVSLPAQAAGIAALQEQDFLDQARRTIARERVWLAQALTDLGFWVCPSQANFLLFSGPPGLYPALLARRIALRPCGNFPGLSPCWYRVAVRRREENQALIAALAAAGKEAPWPKT